ncbi:hypothetical protein AWC38_SpisGene18024 [Stylophora pistillata]|uniref:MYND-type domain-containing protein n=1 Tax=Stylophora pistillata TaxID=50429 RepID=A0A2B4RMR9_STYPI|nr:hypothetical protein AWC38_SpisGene18024 [Stylophora pistillata]
MARYGNQGVPVLSFHNPAGMILYPKGLNTYAMGNTRARDVTELLGTSKEQHLDLLLLASGDVRNFLFTVSELSLRRPHDRPRSLSFHFNDYDPSVIARNAVLIQVANEINPDIPADVDFLWNIWYNLALSQDNFDRLQQVMCRLLAKKFDSAESILKFEDGAVLRECFDIWKDWMTLDLDVRKVKEERTTLIESKMQELKFDVDAQCLGVLSEMMMGLSQEADTQFFEATHANPFYTEVKHWFCEGSTSNESARTNPTLIRPFDHKWRLHYNSCVFESYLPIERDQLLRCKSLTAACKENLKLMLKRFQRQRKNKQTFLKVTLWTGDALALCTSGFPPEMSFDVIDTSNLSDHIGLLNVLVCCAPRPNRSLLFTSSMLWCGGCENVAEYYNKCVGVPFQLLPTILGLKLAVEIELGSSKLPDKMETSEEILCWVKADIRRTLLEIDKTSDVVQGLFRLAERCFDLLNEQTKPLVDGQTFIGSQVYGTTLSSPLTFLRIIHQIQPLVKGGADRLFELLETLLPPEFHKKHSLSWNFLKASIGNERGPVVEIKVNCNMTVPSWYKGTPMPMICIVEPSMIHQFKAQMLSGQMRSTETIFPSIYNSLRYDDKANIVTFHASEKDWNEMKSNAFMWIFSSDMNPVVNSDPVFLGGETIKTSRCVDPVKKFGLFSAQAFTVTETGANCQVLKINKVEENTFSYNEELDILDLQQCTASTMKISFSPIKCPVELQIYFEGATGNPLQIYFSCSVNENLAKFQISRTRKKILCHIPKREDGTVGELVIQNVAPVPFHTMLLWDGKQHDKKMFSKMFRTKLDLELKSQRKSGSPFYNLRESITMILCKHSEEPKTPLVHCVDELGIIEEPYQTQDNMKRKKGFVIKVQEMYKWKFLPVAKVLFCDCQSLADKLQNNPTDVHLMANFFSNTWLHLVHRIVADGEEKTLLRKMLYTNAARVDQESESSVWKNSFITLLFPRQRTLDLFAGLFKGKLKDFPFHPCSFPHQARQPGEHSTQDSFSAFLADFARQMVNFNKGPRDTSDCNLSEWGSPLKEPECAFCHSKEGTLKRCLGCKRVFYCSRNCQKKHWREHKTDCQSIS